MLPMSLVVIVVGVAVGWLRPEAASLLAAVIWVVGSIVFALCARGAVDDATMMTWSLWMHEDEEFEEVARRQSRLGLIAWLLLMWPRFAEARQLIQAVRAMRRRDKKAARAWLRAWRRVKRPAVMTQLLGFAQNFAWAPGEFPLADVLKRIERARLSPDDRRRLLAMARLLNATIALSAGDVALARERLTELEEGGRIGERALVLAMVEAAEERFTECERTLDWLDVFAARGGLDRMYGICDESGKPLPLLNTRRARRPIAAWFEVAESYRRSSIRQHPLLVRAQLAAQAQGDGADAFRRRTLDRLERIPFRVPTTDWLEEFMTLRLGEETHKEERRSWLNERRHWVPMQLLPRLEPALQA